MVGVADVGAVWVRSLTSSRTAAYTPATLTAGSAGPGAMRSCTARGCPSRRSWRVPAWKPRGSGTVRLDGELAGPAAVDPDRSFRDDMFSHPQRGTDEVVVGGDRGWRVTMSTCGEWVKLEPWSGTEGAMSASARRWSPSAGGPGRARRSRPGRLVPR